MLNAQTVEYVIKQMDSAIVLMALKARLARDLPAPIIVMGMVVVCMTLRSIAIIIGMMACCTIKSSIGMVTRPNSVFVIEDGGVSIAP
jgi:hypothetical protein